MPWEAMLGGATGGVAFALVLGILLLKGLADKVLEGAQKKFEATLKRAEELEKSALAMAAAVDTDLRQRRTAGHGQLWKMTGAVPLWPRNTELTYQDLQKLTAELRSWYYESGGMYLSTSARKAYGEVQKLLGTILAKDPDGKVNDADYNAVYDKCSALRTELTRDLLSRREAPQV